MTGSGSGDATSNVSLEQLGPWNAVAAHALLLARRHRAYSYLDPVPLLAETFTGALNIASALSMVAFSEVEQGTQKLIEGFLTLHHVSKDDRVGFLSLARRVEQPYFKREERDFFDVVFERFDLQVVYLEVLAPDPWWFREPPLRRQGVFPSQRAFGDGFEDVGVFALFAEDFRSSGSQHADT